ncbi:MAG: MIP/aquaporin family protein [Prosthecobacter sp.]|uniref:MIP/aquaporin family protein n=1 Tax=Prosthecobacter sp. TaxID=1965333 RepID=UPI0038FF814F
MKKYITELIGTFFLVYAVGHNVIGGNPLAPIGIGLALAVMIYAGGHISGAHFNPAVTVAVWLRGKCDTKDVVPYILCQVGGALLAAMAVSWLRGKATAPADFVLSKLIVAEIIGTFALAWVVLNVATTKANTNNSFYGAAIGLTVTMGAFAVGNISGAAFNPAVATGAVAMNILKSGQLWAYWVFCITGAGVAAFVFNKLKVDE